jgi:hypothetical protein
MISWTVNTHSSAGIVFPKLAMDFVVTPKCVQDPLVRYFIILRRQVTDQLVGKNSPPFWTKILDEIRCPDTAEIL